ncbi:MAG TPA: hypothetical protein VK970_01265, partial [Candidatus Methylacidiphilales bacterium]|nr:hypothetical protein [Candidatus Methylacidiphilales bacterium]
DICQRLNSADFIREIAMHINQPNATLLDSTWIRFRFIQSLILQALILLQSYPNFNIHIKSIEDDELKKDFLTNINIRMEHDAHDLEYLILGLHFGSLATEETSKANKSMSSRFRLLSPNGELLTLNSIIEPSP